MSSTSLDSTWTPRTATVSTSAFGTDAVIATERSTAGSVGGRSTAQSRRPVNSGWGPKAASPKSPGRYCGSVIVTGARLSRPERDGEEGGIQSREEPPARVEPGKEPWVGLGRATDPQHVRFIQPDFGERGGERDPGRRQRAQPGHGVVEPSPATGGRGGHHHKSPQGAAPLSARRALLECAHLLQ
jgi:hypothetical protein